MKVGSWGWVMIEVILPFPPSVNHYWAHRQGKGRVIAYVAAKGRKFRHDAIQCAVKQKAIYKLKDRLKVTIELYPPDRRRRDLDNFNKGVLDALTHAEVWEDDSLIDELIIKRGEIVKGGETVVKIELMEAV